MNKNDEFDPKTCIMEPGGFWKFSNWKWHEKGWSCDKRWISKNRIGLCLAIGPEQS